MREEEAGPPEGCRGRSDMFRPLSPYSTLSWRAGTGGCGSVPLTRVRAWPGSPPPIIIACLWLALGFGCAAAPDAAPAEEAFVARKTVELWRELIPDAPTVATLDLGERVEIVGRRRRFVKVRGTAGDQGWTHESMLITPDVRKLMEQLHDQASADPPQGTVLALRTLNVHLEPYRWSATIYQLRQDEGAELLRHRLVERLPRRPQEGKPAPAPTGRDDWYLVRVAGGQAGWVLATGVYSGIPDEVKQFAERRRITSYFTLGEVLDRRLGKAKTTWLWTQTERLKQPHDFDLIRVFMWSRRGRFYQTIKMERGLVGYLPVLVHQDMDTRWGRGPGFSLNLEMQGRRLRRTYALVNNRVRRVGEEVETLARPPIRLIRKIPSPPPSPGLREKILDWWRK